MEVKVMKGWVCKSKNYDMAQFFEDKPIRVELDTPWPYWMWDKQSCCSMLLPEGWFSELTWEDEPIEVELTIKRV